MGFSIRAADPVSDRAAMLSFIDGLQAFEFAIEPNRRLDNTVAAEHMAVLEKRLAERGGAIFIAEDDDGPLGWSVVHETEDDLFVIESERRMAYIDELYLIERARGLGAGRSLIAACETWAKTRGIDVIMIGVLDKNTRAREIYNTAGYHDHALQLRKYL
jgi:GNAT superfamily N-acetyltransferase